jgi:hypothetical protein
MSFHDHEWEQFWVRFDDLLLSNFQSSAIKKPAWSDTNGPEGASFTYHTSTSLIRPIWRIFNGLEATDVIS